MKELNTKIASFRCLTKGGA